MTTFVSYLRSAIDALAATVRDKTVPADSPVRAPTEDCAQFARSTVMTLPALPSAPVDIGSMINAVGCAQNRVGIVAHAFEAAFIRFGIEDRARVQTHIIANCAHESNQFTLTRENLNYSSVMSIRKTFGGNRGIAHLTDAELIGLVNNPVALANIVYADRWRDTDHQLGNTKPDDGWRFRGWGWAQLTGRAVMERFAASLGTASAETLAAMTDPAVFAHSAVWFAVVEKHGFIDAAERDDIAATRSIWNGGQIALAEVRAARLRIKQQTGV